MNVRVRSVKSGQARKMTIKSTCGQQIFAKKPAGIPHRPEAVEEEDIAVHAKFETSYRNVTQNNTNSGNTCVGYQACASIVNITIILIIQEVEEEAALPEQPVSEETPAPRAKLWNVKIGVMGKKDRIDHSNDWKVVRTGVVGGTPTFTNTDGKVPAGAFPAGKYLVWMSPVNRQGRPEGLGAVAAYVQNAEDESLRCWTIPVGFPVRKLEPTEVDPVRGADLCRFGCWGFLVELDWHKAVVFVNAVIGLDHEKGLKNLRRSCDS